MNYACTHVMPVMVQREGERSGQVESETKRELGTPQCSGDQAKSIALNTAEGPCEAGSRMIGVCPSYCRSAAPDQSAPVGWDGGGSGCDCRCRGSPRQPQTGTAIPDGAGAPGRGREFREELQRLVEDTEAAGVPVGSIVQSAIGSGIVQMLA